MEKNNLTIQEAADLMGVSAQFIRVGLQQKAFGFGYAIKIGGGNRYTYFISAAKFEEETGIKTRREEEK